MRVVRKYQGRLLFFRSTIVTYGTLVIVFFSLGETDGSSTSVRRRRQEGRCGQYGDLPLDLISDTVMWETFTGFDGRLRPKEHFKVQPFEGKPPRHNLGQLGEYSTT